MRRQVYKKTSKIDLVLVHKKRDLPFVIHVEELAYQLIYSMFGLDFYIDGKEECQKEQNTTRDGYQLWYRQLTSMIIGSSVWNSILESGIFELTSYCSIK